MQVISLNIGKSIQVEWKNQQIYTSIYKKSVTGKRNIFFSSIEGDSQSDLKNHGGLDKAIYAYSSEYYDIWKELIDFEKWEYGVFGENLTTKGLLDSNVRIGNIYKVGTAKLQAIQPRFPCFKLNIRFGMDDMVKIFSEMKMNGIYFKVIEEGEIQSGDKIELLKNSDYSITISDIVECRNDKGKNKDKLKEILQISDLPTDLIKKFEEYDLK